MLFKFYLCPLLKLTSAWEIAIRALISCAIEQLSKGKQIRYQLEYHPEPNSLSIHIDKILTRQMIEVFDSEDMHESTQPEVVKDLFGVDGVGQISLHRYNLSIRKAKVFSWEEMIPRLIFILQMHLDPVSVNSFLDTRRPKIMLHQRKHIVAHVLPGQGLCSHAVQSARSHCIDAGTRAVPSGVLPRYQKL
jgi:hypothetical protein